jgi:hypothetical protein
MNTDIVWDINPFIREIINSLPWIMNSEAVRFSATFGLIYETTECQSQGEKNIQ